jgi:toluene monooxygenase system protein E
MTITEGATERRRRKTWSLYEERRKPTEYEVVTHRLNYHFGREPTPFELDPDTPINRWYMQHREGSAFQVDDWEGFRDPAKLTYRAYVALQRERESYLDNLIDEFERGDHYAGLDSGWVSTLDRLYLPSRFSGHVLQMVSLYVSQMAPSSYITVAYHFQGGDEMRRVQRNAYLAKVLSLDHSEELANSAHTRSVWEDDEHWQPMRELLERLLVAYDWGEAFAALALVAKPAHDALFNDQLGQLARQNGDELLALLAHDFRLDEERHRRTAQALVAYAVERKPELRGVLVVWVQKWQPLAAAAVEGLSGLLAQARQPLDAGAVRDAATQRMRAFAEECGLT